MMCGDVRMRDKDEKLYNSCGLQHKTAKRRTGSTSILRQGKGAESGRVTHGKGGPSRGVSL